MRLKRRRLIRPLFDRNRSDVHSLAVGCVRLIYRRAPREEAGAGAPVQVGFAVGRGVRKAVTRNRLKRIMREVYRVHQHLLVDLFSQTPDTLTVMVLFRGDPKQGRTCIPRDLPEALRRLARRMTVSAPPESRP
jgi:ribonuclease P protein component